MGTTTSTKKTLHPFRNQDDDWLIDRKMQRRKISVSSSGSNRRIAPLQESQTRIAGGEFNNVRVISGCESCAAALLLLASSSVSAAALPECVCQPKIGVRTT
jgi:hypothetical protein